MGSVNTSFFLLLPLSPLEAANATTAATTSSTTTTTDAMTTFRLTFRRGGGGGGDGVIGCVDVISARLEVAVVDPPGPAVRGSDPGPVALTLEDLHRDTPPDRAGVGAGGVRLHPRVRAACHNVRG